MSGNTSNLAHGVYYVTRDGSAVYKVDDGDVLEYGTDEPERRSTDEDQR